MRIVIQRVSQAQVAVEKKIIGKINQGAMVLFGASKQDHFSQIPQLVKKLVHLRMFSDQEGKMNLSLLDIKAEVLIVSQFTLYADCYSGNRPSFTPAADPKDAIKLYERFIAETKKHLKVQTGSFGAMMEVALTNDGPVTFIIDAKN